MEEKINQTQSSETESQEYIDLADAEVMTQKADEVWSRVKESPVTVEELDKLVPMSNEFLKGLVGIIAKEIESGEKQHAVNADLLRANQEIILKLLEKGTLTSQERIEIIRKLSELSSVIAKGDNERDRRHENTKRFIVGGAVLAFIASVIAFSRADS